ncbi:MAG: PorT family protein [Candidatus Krumholzibacteria bacterium]|nr:PorT family protein [Candidatus Krumholzibacteria bacterium]
MLRATVVGALLALVCATLPARVEAQPKWNWGLRAGFDVTKFSGDPVSRWLSGPDFQITGQVPNTRYGFTGGLFLRRQMSERFALALEALYTQKG